VEPTADEVRLQLDRILASEGFANADRMSGFLRYVVDRSLAGEGDKVKEYAIGIDVFGRNHDYDPRLDSIVRVEARRLRSKVDEYYAGVGREDPVRILLRRGTYVPAFERADATPRIAEPPPPTDTALGITPPRRGAGWRIGLALAIVALVLVTIAARRGGLWATTARQAPPFSAAVLPFAEYSSDPADVRLAARLTDGITSQLARIGTVGVVSHTSALQFGGTRRRPVREIASVLNADFVVEGTIARSGDRLDVSVRIVNALTDRKFWVQDFVGTTTNPRELERNIAAAVASQISNFRR
jgi:TolB-like protein